ncbi:MAG: dynamin family protein [Chloroflexi bacterium]|nr:dynamin family protein [Chloroflexota bacterium]
MEAENVQPTTSSFETFREAELNAVTDLKRIRDVSQRIGLEEGIVELIDTALERLKERRFSIAIVGEFKRGKSTFINALLQKEILPADILPCSATLNRVRYSIQSSVEIVYKGENGADGRVEEIAVDELQEYVTKLTPESEQVAASIKEAIVYYPLPYLKNNVEIIDTPGMNDDDTMTAVTLGVLPEVSAAVLIIMPESPFSKYEADFLNNQLLLSDLSRVIFVVTAMDRIMREKDRQRVLDGIRQRITNSVEERLAEQFGQDSDDYKLYRKQIGVPRIFGLSGYQALIAREENDEELYAKSGFGKFEEALEQFVTETRGAAELQVVSNRIISASNEILKKLEMEAGIMQMKQTEFDEKYNLSMAELDTLLQRRDEEIGQIDEAAKKTMRRLRPYIDELPGQIKQAAVQVIDEIEISADDMKKDTFQEKLNRIVMEAIRTATKRHSEKIQIEIERDLSAELNRLGDFAEEVTRVLRDVEMQFYVPESQDQSPDAAFTALAGIAASGFGGVISGYMEAGGKGAAVGGAAGFGAAVASGVVLLTLGLPLTWPVMIPLGILAAFTGKWTVRSVFKGQRIDSFRESYKEQVLQQIDEQLRAKSLEAEVKKQVEMTYNAIKERLMGELDVSMEQTRKTLDTLRSQKARKELEAEHNRKERENLRLETERIRTRNQALSDYVVDLTHI